MAPKLSIELRTEIFALCAQNSVRKTLKMFNHRHSERAPLSFGTVTKIWDKILTTRSVHDRKRSGRPITSVSKENSAAVLAKMKFDPNATVRSLAHEARIS